MSRYAPSAVNAAKAARTTNRKAQAKQDASERRQKANPRTYAPSTAQLSRAMREAAAARDSAAQPKYIHDSMSYKRRESPMAAVNIAMESGRVDGIKVN